MLNSRLLGLFIVPIIFLLNSCGGSSAVVQTNDDIKEEETIRYINLIPIDTKILDHNNPTFYFERSTNSTSSTATCSTNSPIESNTPEVASRTDEKNTTLRVIKINSVTGEAEVVVDENLYVPNECKFEVNFPSLILEENIGYAWRVSGLNVEDDENTQWNSFVYSPNALGVENEDPHACLVNMIDDWTFTERPTKWKSMSVPLNTSQLAGVFSNGHDDIGAGTFQSPSDILYQRLATPMVQGMHYQLKFSLKHQGKTDFQIKVLAFNNDLTSQEPSAETAVVAVTGTMVNQQNNWVKVTLPAWRAINDFENLAIVVLNEENTVVKALIDRVCLSEVKKTACAPSTDDTTGLPEGFNLSNSDPVITNFEYLLGSVSDLHPDQDTSNSEWFLQEDSSTLECTSIGEYEFTEDLEEELSHLDGATEEEEAAQQEIESLLADIDDPSNFELDTTNLNSGSTASPQKCGKRIVDYTKPFSGRDIVYVHGLQKDAVDDLTRIGQFQKYDGHLWPDNPHAFYRNGKYYSEAVKYWKDHIDSTLGSSTNPSNSYMIVTWSALQRARVGVNVILHQIRNARAGTRTDNQVVFSQNGENEEQCFGDNGIVFVTHSTGGMLVSLMFGDMEDNKNNRDFYNYVEPELQELFDAQVGFNAAYGRSGVATAGLLITHNKLRPLEAYQSILVDLGVPTVSALLRLSMDKSEKPSFLMVGTTTGPKHNLGSEDSSTKGAIFLKGYNDSVLTSWVQSAHKRIRPKYWHNPLKSGKLVDLGASLPKSRAMLRRGYSPIPLQRRYYVSPAFAPSGMLQDEVFLGYFNQRKYLRNHFPIIQTTGNHFDNVNEIIINGRDYYRPSFSSNNNEETSVVYDYANHLYDSEFLSSEFKNLQQASVKKETWGLHLPRLSWIRKPIKVFGKLIGYIRFPKVSWHYREFTKWKRTYHLLEDYQNKNGADYMYKYLLRP